MWPKDRSLSPITKSRITIFHWEKQASTIHPIPLQVEKARFLVNMAKKLGHPAFTQLFHRAEVLHQAEQARILGPQLPLLHFTLKVRAPCQEKKTEKTRVFCTHMVPREYLRDFFSLWGEAAYNNREL